MEQQFQDLSEKAQRHLPLLGLFAKYVRPRMLEYFVGSGDEHQEYYEELAGATLDAGEWEELLNEARDVDMAKPVGPGVFELHPSLFSVLRGRMYELYGGEGMKKLNYMFVELYSRFCTELVERWGGSAVIPTLIVEEPNIIRAAGLAVDFEAWMDLIKILICLAQYLKEEERTAEWKKLRCKLIEIIGREQKDDVPIEKAESWIFFLRDEASDLEENDRLDEAEKNYQAILNYLRSRNDPGADQHRGIVFHQLGMIEQQRGSDERAVSWYNRALETLGGLGGAGLKLNTLAMLGILHLGQGRFADAVGYLCRAYQDAMESGSRNTSAVLFQLGLCLEAMGEDDFTKAVPPAEEKLKPPLHIIRQMMKEAGK